ncbi:hypothetical protein DFH06DRAFT_1297888 [Mycena polygramma]|nr:hypothetical protein DFH06DRAFT_1297888 [Mycena polygramma]
MSIPLTFVDRKLLDTALVDPNGAVHYTTSTTKGLIHRKVTTITAASGLVGFLDWHEEAFVINGVQREVKHLKSRAGVIFSSEREWNWGNKPYKLKYHDFHKELLATPITGNVELTVRFKAYHPHLFKGNEGAIIYFPHQMQDEIERMFLLMAILETETHRQDREKRGENIELAAGAAEAAEHIF